MTGIVLARLLLVFLLQVFKPRFTRLGHSVLAYLWVVGTGVIVGSLETRLLNSSLLHAAGSDMETEFCAA